MEIKDCNFKIDGKSILVILKHMKISEKLQLVKEIITQLVVCQVLLISKYDCNRFK